MQQLKKQFQQTLLSTHRDGMENVIKHLERLGFFDAPASTKFHLNVKGGLMQHSWNVYQTGLYKNYTGTISNCLQYLCISFMK